MSMITIFGMLKYRQQTPGEDMTKEELLKLSVITNDIPLFETLIKNEAVDLNWADEDGRTVLHWAAMMEHGYEFAKILIALRADPRKQDKQGHSPLSLAQSMKKERNAELLQEILSHPISLPPESTQFTARFSPGAFTVLIVGGGMAGITAAYELIQKGYNVTLIEARERLGGRLETVYLDDTPVELGCQFIHGSKGNPLMPLIEKYKINFKPVTSAKRVIYDPEGKILDLESISPFVKIALKKIDAISKRRISNASKHLSQDESFFQYFIKNILTQGSIGVPNQKESLLLYKFGQTPDYQGGNHLVTNGYNRLIEGLLQEAAHSGRLEIKLGHVVEKISEKHGKVYVYTKDHGHFEGDSIVCAVPLGVLKQNTIIFNPPLPHDKKRAIERLGMAIHDKIILQFDQAFWPEDVHYLNPYDYENDMWREIVNLYHFSDGKIAALSISSHADIAQLDKPDAVLVENALQMLKKIFGNNIPPLKYSMVTRWYQDPFSYGSYSYHTKESSLADNSALAKPMGHICFAGEHTSHFPSSLDGAYLSGVQAANEVIKLLHSDLKSV